MILGWTCGQPAPADRRALRKAQNRGGAWGDRMRGHPRSLAAGCEAPPDGGRAFRHRSTGAGVTGVSRPGTHSANAGEAISAEHNASRDSEPGTRTRGQGRVRGGRPQPPRPLFRGCEPGRTRGYLDSEHRRHRMPTSDTSHKSTSGTSELQVQWDVSVKAARTPVDQRVGRHQVLKPAEAPDPSQRQRVH